MKKTLLKLTGLTAFIALAVLVLGCSNPAEGGDGDGDPSAEAAQLAADINNRPKSSPGDIGRAEANGSTVTLKGGFIDIRTNLTVSAGVTLDVTADGHLGLHDMILTVNGTANVNSNHIRLEDTATYGIINGSGTIHLKGKGRLLEVEGNHNVADRTLTLDGVTLVGVADNDSSLVVVRSGGEGRSGEFIMKSGAITGNTHTSNDRADGGGVRVDGEGAIFTMEGGTITNNTATATGSGEAAGGGVCVDEGTFTMNGSAMVTGNTATTTGSGWVFGGGVWAEGAFTMNGSAMVTGNTAIATGSGEAHGGGVRTQPNSAFIMNDNAAVTDNTVTTTGSGHAQGGGVRMYQGAFTMNGSATVTGNTATATGSGGAPGGGVCVDEGTFTMNGSATVTGNTATGSGGGVAMWHQGTFTMNDNAAVMGNTATSSGHVEGGGVKIQSNSAFIMNNNAAITGNTVTATGSGKATGGGVEVDGGVFTLSGGTVYGDSGHLPSEADPDLANTVTTVSGSTCGAALFVSQGQAVWGTGGTYTGGYSQADGTSIVDGSGGTDDTLIAVPAP